MAYKTGHGISEDGRQGIAKLADGSFSLDMQERTPEELYAMAYAACYASALNRVKEPRRIDNAHRVEVIIDVDEDSSDLVVQIKVAFEGLDQDIAERIAKLGDKVCRYSTAVEGNIKKTVEVIPY